MTHRLLPGPIFTSPSVPITAVRARQAPTAWNLWAFGAVTAFAVMNLTESAFHSEILWMLVLFVWVWAQARHSAGAPFSCSH